MRENLPLLLVKPIISLLQINTDDKKKCILAFSEGRMWVIKYATAMKKRILPFFYPIGLSVRAEALTV